MRRARFKIVDEILDGFRLPDGYEEVWRRPASDAIGDDVTELLIVGPFDDSLPEDAFVTATMHTIGIPPAADYELQWHHDGEPVSRRLSMPKPGWFAP